MKEKKVCSVCGSSDIEKPNAIATFCNNCDSYMRPIWETKSKIKTTEYKKGKKNLSQIDYSALDLGPNFLTGNSLNKYLNREYYNGLCGTFSFEYDFHDSKRSLLISLVEDVNLRSRDLMCLIQWMIDRTFKSIFPIYELPVLINVIKALKRFNEDFDEDFQEYEDIPLSPGDYIPFGTKKLTYCEEHTYKVKLRKKPSKNYKYCTYCEHIYYVDRYSGEVLARFNPEDLDLKYRKDAYERFINYYNPIAGISVESGPTLHQALLIVEDKRKRNRFMKFYTWRRRFKIKGDSFFNDSMGENWKAFFSNNLYKKEALKNIINDLTKLHEIWVKNEQ
ncbi:MAG: hypothetical protein ACTSUE_01960 [Promethearchaeota archaeon]